MSSALFVLSLFFMFLFAIRCFVPFQQRWHLYLKVFSLYPFVPFGSILDLGSFPTLLYRLFGKCLFGSMAPCSFFRANRNKEETFKYKRKGKRSREEVITLWWRQTICDSWFVTVKFSIFRYSYKIYKQCKWHLSNLHSSFNIRVNLLAKRFFLRSQRTRIATNRVYCL